ncbi:MAG: hypothetical protein AB7F35_04210 [Acetobacteraceae bacterium]
MRHPRPEGLRTWPVNGFREFQIYYLSRPDSMTILRILHGKRDVGAILDAQEP